ncbi:MAG: glycosyltransferase [Kaiparowitsia implicata GSE-PSE-MK54-09C]|jgi:glycosyltransferase involved in cell wall biosynthesis|nr:glycosyltransferase [Kaiparowitsia implicata GSE-PSE-MK54-09C]
MEPAVNQPMVSVIINNYNYERFLKQSIDSALAQTYPKTEVIVVDDGSTDQSKDVITHYGSQITPLLKQNGGQASAMNAGYEMSQGDLLIFLDADDYLFPETAEQVVAAWNPAIALVQYRLELVDEVGQFLELHPVRERPLDSGNVLPQLLERGRYGTTVTSGLAFSRHALKQVLPIPAQDFPMSADGYLVTVVPFYGELAVVETPLGAYRKHGNNMWAFASDSIPVERFRKSIEHEFQKYRYLALQAEKQGHQPAQDLGDRDYLHLMSRIASLRLEPSLHPSPTDSGLRLAYRGSLAVWRYSGYASSRKLVLTVWFFWVGLMPKPLTEPAIAWLMASSSRPAWIDSIVKRVRALTT